jgi:hypothetical protein
MRGRHPAVEERSVRLSAAAPTQVAKRVGSAELAKTGANRIL